SIWVKKGSTIGSQAVLPQTVKKGAMINPKQTWRPKGNYLDSVKGNLVRGLPSKTFKLDHSCLACRKGKQHRASCKKIEERTVREPLELLHMDLFGPVRI
ncbi:hypothetical protein Tco_0479987, partial [Tanacetum coccineum]